MDSRYDQNLTPGLPPTFSKISSPNGASVDLNCALRAIACSLQPGWLKPCLVDVDVAVALVFVESRAASGHFDRIAAE